MICTGCGTQSADSDVLCGGCGNAQRQARGNDAQPAAKPAIFRLGQAMQQRAITDGSKGWNWGAWLIPGALAVALTGLVCLGFT
jgi:hypothetical protein